MIGKHYIVTGGTSGLGLEIVKQLLTRGALVTIIARNNAKYDAIDFGDYKHKVTMIQCDLLDKERIIEIAKLIECPIHGLIYSSGLGYFKSIRQHSSSEMIETYEVNLISFNLIFQSLRPLLANQASIVAISSQAAFVTQANASHYGASKAALNAVLNALRIEEPNYHIMAVNAGPIQTPFHEKADPSLNYAKKYESIMINPKQFSNEIVKGMIKQKSEINKPHWMHNMLKLYQLAPRTIEKYFTPLFRNKS
ncbi:SDR family NAD(P)-dependent oxidoreductase [Staphylococcus taiwanensis]|nr:SDR family NAD(P)-dependent oxidoreductase [Staphylococcus taiwanensis]